MTRMALLGSHLPVHPEHAAGRSRRYRPRVVLCGSGGHPLVSMVKATEDGNGDELGGCRLGGWLSPRDRLVPVEALVWSDSVIIILDVLAQKPLAMPLVQHDHVVQAFPADRADDSLDLRILPGRVGRNENLLDAESMGTSREVVVVDAITVWDHVARSSVPGEDVVIQECSP